MGCDLHGHDNELVTVYDHVHTKNNGNFRGCNEFTCLIISNFLNNICIIKCVRTI